jgi:DNA-binding MarR family transcriptional regulator
MHRSRPIDYETLAELRYQVRRFLRVRELAARASGVAPQQYLVLLQIRGVVALRPVTISVLAERLQIHHHSAVQLVDRLSRQGLVERRRDGRDRRSVIVELRPRGEALLQKLALYSMAELKTEGPALASSLRRLVMNASRRSSASHQMTRDSARSRSALPGGV